MVKVSGPDEKRFHSYVDHEAGSIPAHAPELGPCSPWKAWRTRQGYGGFWLGGRTRPAHAAALLVDGHDIPSGMEVMHLCDNPPCVRVEHLTIGTAAENKADMTAKGRQARGENQHLAKLTEAQVREIRDQHAAGTCDQRRFAELFGVNRKTINQVVNRQTWKHLP